MDGVQRRDWKREPADLAPGSLPPQACRACVTLELFMPLMEALCERQVSHMSHGHSWLLVTILQGTWKVDPSRVWSVSGIADGYKA